MLHIETLDQLIAITGFMVILGYVIYKIIKPYVVK